MASRRAQRRRFCEKKRRFNTEAEAFDARNRQQYREGRELAVYKCQWGPTHYHIGHQDVHLSNPHGAKYGGAVRNLPGTITTRTPQRCKTDDSSVDNVATD